MSCPDLCTAAKCEELENRIGALEIALELLEAAFEAHTQQDIPEAHGFNFEPTEPEPTEDPEVSVDVSARGDGNFLIRVAVGDKSDSDGFSVDIPEIPEPVEPEVSVNVSETGEDQYSISVGVGTKQGQGSFTITHPDIPKIPEQNEDSNVEVTADYVNNILTITVAHNNSFDTAQVYIDADVINNFGSGGSSVNCENKIDDCCAAMLRAIGNLSTQLTNVELAINSEVQQIYNEVTIDITGTANSDYKCEVPETLSEQETPQLSEFTPTEIVYSGSGLRGIHENLKLINANLDSIFEITCEGESTDVVSLVASDAYITRATGKYLVLHFVELDNYPKRSNTASFWQVQIPAAQSSYVWNDDFLNLRFKRGNQYAELRFNEFQTAVSGFFKSEAAANSYFDAVLGLTTATEKNRVIPKHSVPQTAVATRETRPYRAFINSVNSQGQAVCHVKYVPPKENE